MKILQVFDFISLSQGGGTTAVLHNLSKTLVKRGHDVTIYTSDFGVDQESQDLLKDINIQYFHCTSTLGGFYFTPSLCKAIKDNIREFDIIHLHCVRNFPNILIHHYTKKYNIPYILDTHGSLPLKVKGENGMRWASRWLFDTIYGKKILYDASKILAETDTGAKAYIDFGIDNTKIAIIPPIFPIDEYSNLPHPGLFKRKYHINKHIILFLGLIRWIKGLDFLVDSFKELTKIRDDVILVIAGTDDGFKSTLESQIKSLGLSNDVLFTDFLDKPTKLSALVDADIVVQPSRYEYGIGVPYEAIVCNTPVIMTTHTSSAEHLRRIGGAYFVFYGNKWRFSKTMDYILKNYSQVLNLTQKARQHIIDNLSPDKAIEAYEDLYQEVIRYNRVK